MRRRKILKEAFSKLEIALSKELIHERVYLRHVKTFESNETEMNYEDMDTYFRLYIFRHVSKSLSLKKIFGSIDNLLSCKNIYKQILYHKSYVRFR
jgi:hypothetical protein